MWSNGFFPDTLAHPRAVHLSNYLIISIIFFKDSRLRSEVLYCIIISVSMGFKVKKIPQIESNCFVGLKPKIQHPIRMFKLWFLNTCTTDATYSVVHSSSDSSKGPASSFTRPVASALRLTLPYSSPPR